MNNDQLNKKILLVDDDPQWLEIFSYSLRDLDLQILTAKDGIEAELLLLKKQFDLVILDAQMPRMNGVELLKIIRILFPTLPVLLFFSGLPGSTITGDDILHLGADRVMEKGQAKNHLKAWVETWMKIQNLKENVEFQDLLSSPATSPMPYSAPFSPPKRQLSHHKE